jgi:hypothetical protein
MTMNKSNDNNINPIITSFPSTHAPYSLTLLQQVTHDRLRTSDLDLELDDSDQEDTDGRLGPAPA